MVVGFHTDAIHHDVGCLSTNPDRREGDPNNHQSRKQDDVGKYGGPTLGVFHEILFGLLKIRPGWEARPYLQ
jgi:hypothetical protein